MKTVLTGPEGIETQGAPTGFVLGLHHNDHVEAVAGEVLPLQTEEECVRGRRFPRAITLVYRDSRPDAATDSGSLPEL